LQVQSKEENRNKGEGTTSAATSSSTARGTLGDSRALRNNIYTNSSLQAVRGTLTVTRARFLQGLAVADFQAFLFFHARQMVKRRMNKDT
jgi:hypothetical protein